MAIQTPEWVKHAIFYQIFPDRFARSERLTKPVNLEPWDSQPTTRGFKGGDLLGVVEHLDYLEALGINALYFNPVFQSAANHRYHTHDYFHVDPILGGDSALRTLLDAAHVRGIRVILDGVFNHASRGFYQFNHLMENGASSPYTEWFHVREFPVNAFDDRKKPNFACWWDNRELPQLNTDHIQVREFLFAVAEHWIRAGIDGWRLDVPLEIKTPGFWEEFRRRVRAINPDAYILAEIWHEAQPWLGGNHFDAVMNYPFNRACLEFFGGKALNTKEHPGGFKLKACDARDFAGQVDGMLTIYAPEVVDVQYNLLSSHDEPRFLTMVGEEKHRLQLATLFQMTYPGAPSVYYGDEVGMLGGSDPDCRRSFPWDESLWDRDLLAFFKRAIALRRDHLALRNGEYTTLHARGQSYAFARHNAAEAIVIALNAGDKPESLTLNLKNIVPGEGLLKDAWEDEQLPVSQGRLTLTVPPFTGRVLIGAP